MKTPRLRSSHKTSAPYVLNNFPDDFVEKFSKEMICLFVFKSDLKLSGDDWEKIFANCIGGTRQPSNDGLDDIVLKDCCWSAKTVQASSKTIENQSNIRLISGRCSPKYSYGFEDGVHSISPNELGEMVLNIWNQRVLLAKAKYNHTRIVVLLRGKDTPEYIIFEKEMNTYSPDAYRFEWNDNDNLEGYNSKTNEHVFTWQPHGGQLTIIETVPGNHLYVKVKQPEALNKANILKNLKVDETWWEFKKTNTDESSKK